MVYVTLCGEKCVFLERREKYEIFKVQNKRPLRLQKPLGFGSFLLEQVLANQHLHQLVPVDLADHAPGVVVI